MSDKVLKTRRQYLFSEVSLLASTPEAALLNTSIQQRAAMVVNACAMDGMHFAAARVLNKHGVLLMDSPHVAVPLAKFPMAEDVRVELSRFGVSRVHPAHTLALSPAPEDGFADLYRRNIQWAFQHAMGDLRSERSSPALASMVNALPVMREAKKLAVRHGNITFLAEANRFQAQLRGKPTRPEQKDNVVHLVPNKTL